MMKVGVCVVFDTIETMEKKLEDIIREGFDNCQIISWDPSIRTEENAARLNRLLSEKGVTVSAFWCGWDGP